MDLLDNDDLTWRRFTSSPRFDYEIDYSEAILDIRDGGYIDVLYRWAPNMSCHFHRHRCSTTSTVLEGELRITEYDATGAEIGTRVRPTGDYSHAGNDDDCHIETGGPEGALVVFHLHTPDGELTDILDRDAGVIRTTTVDELREVWSATD